MTYPKFMKYMHFKGCELLGVRMQSSLYAWLYRHLLTSKKSEIALKRMNRGKRLLLRSFNQQWAAILVLFETFNPEKKQTQA
jgi:hypothetical protein